jgi:hypothetical protein
MGKDDDEKEREHADEMQCRKLLLDFYSSQINTHGALIIGFSVVLFAIIQIRISPVIWNNVSILQDWILYFGIFLTGFALYYLFLRYITYGTMAHSTIRIPWKDPVCDSDSFRDAVSIDVQQKAQLRRLIKYFTTSTWQGFLIAFSLSLLTTFFLALVLDYSWFVRLFHLLTS